MSVQQNKFGKKPEASLLKTSCSTRLQLTMATRRLGIIVVTDSEFMVPYTNPVIDLLIIINSTTILKLLYYQGATLLTLKT